MKPPKTLTVKFTNADGARLDMIHAQVSTPVITRIVQVELTPEQIAQLRPRVTGSSGVKNTYEEWEIVSLSQE